MNDLFAGMSLDDDEGPIAPASTVTAEMTNAIAAPAVEVLPLGTLLPTLVKFVPNPAWRQAADDAAAVALAVDVTGREGIKKADEALSNLRQTITFMKSGFKDPKAAAYKIHKDITALENEWSKVPDETVVVVSKKIVAETKRLDDADAAEVKRQQAIQDEEAKERARQLADKAAAQGASAATVDQLKQRAETITAPPVATRSVAAPPKNSTLTETKRCRLVGTPDDAEEFHPDVKDFTDAQRASFLKLMKEILNGRLPVAVIKTIDWSYLDKRAAADGDLFKFDGLETFMDRGLKAKPRR